HLAGHHRYQLRIETQLAFRLAVLHEAGIDGDDALAHADHALDHPVERAAVEHLVGAPGRHLGDVAGDRLLAGLALLGTTLLLPVGEFLDGFDADAKFDDVESHDRIRTGERTGSNSTGDRRARKSRGLSTASGTRF